MELFTAILSIIFSGLLGVIISSVYQSISEKRKWKLKVLEQLLGNRHDILGDKFTEALNSVFVVFHDSEKVVLALKAFHENTMGIRTPEQANQRLLDLFKAMCQDLKINPAPLTDNFFLQPFNSKRG